MYAVYPIHDPHTIRYTVAPIPRGVHTTREESPAPTAHNKFAKPEKLIAWLQKNAPLVRLRPDHRVIVQRVWPDERQRLSGVTSIVSSLAKLAA